RLQGWRTIARAPSPSGGRSAHQIEAPARTPGATLSGSETDRMSLRIPGIRDGARATSARAPIDLPPSLYFTAQTQIAPPWGTSGYLPGKIRFMRVCIFAGSTPQPDWTAMYCLPSTSNDTGTAATPDPVGNSHRILPVLASKARNMRSLVPPANRRPPPVASTGPQLNDGRFVVLTFFPASRSHACSSPMWSAAATIFMTFFATPMKRSPCTYLGASPASSVHKLSLAGM